MSPWAGFAAQEQLTRLVEFASRSAVDDGFGYLLADGTLDPGRPVETWITARMAHVFSLAVLAGASSEDHALHGVRALRGALEDHDHGGWFSDVTRASSKDAYVHAFVVLAGASAATAGIEGGRALLDDALQVWDQRFWDPTAVMAVEEWDPSWRELSGYRGANSNMHGVEAMLAAADAVTDAATASSLRRRALAVVERIVHGEARSRDWRLPEHFSSTWEADLDYNRDAPADPFRPFGVTVGHQFEWARLCFHLADALGADAPSWLTADAESLYQAAGLWGWGADDAPGFVYTLDWENKPVVTSRMHWVLAEAVAAAAVLHTATGKGAYLDDHRRWSDHAATCFLDPATGNWHHELDPQGRVATGTWAGQPDAYHVVQALLLTDLPVTGSVASGLLTRCSARVG